MRELVALVLILSGLYTGPYALGEVHAGRAVSGWLEFGLAFSSVATACWLRWRPFRGVKHTGRGVASTGMLTDRARRTARLRPATQVGTTPRFVPVPYSETALGERQALQREL